MKVIISTSMNSESARAGTSSRNLAAQLAEAKIQLAEAQKVVNKLSASITQEKKRAITDKTKASLESVMELLQEKKAKLTKEGSRYSISGVAQLKPSGQLAGVYLSKIPSDLRGETDVILSIDVNSVGVTRSRTGADKVSVTKNYWKVRVTPRSLDSGWEKLLNKVAAIKKMANPAVVVKPKTRRVLTKSKSPIKSSRQKTKKSITR